MNEWADEKTKGMIPQLLPDDYDAADLAFILMNALYFKDSWIDPFERFATEEKDFHAADGSAVRKDFMTQTESCLYYDDGDTQLVILPMKDGIYMAFVLGDTDSLGEKTAQAAYRSVRVTIPKIDLETSFSSGEFCDFLKDGGVSLAFTADADFSGMIDHQILIDDIIQKTKIKLDEDGVEAAAVTAIMMTEGAMLYEDIAEFTADRPFSFYIYTTANDVTEMMFAGQIVK